MDNLIRMTIEHDCRRQICKQKILRLYFSDNSWGDYDLQSCVCQRNGISRSLN